MAVTGAETLYVDMGHFGRPGIRRAWFGVVMPGLILSYFGQGAVLLADPSAIQNQFFLMAPSWGLVPLVVLATLATIIASQAVISGAFSITRQAVQLGYWPRMVIQHTSASEEGQIYLPRVNILLFIAVLVLVVGFGSSDRLAHAYGFAVTGTMLMTSLLVFLVLPKNSNQDSTQYFSDSDLQAIAHYLKSLPAQESSGAYKPHSLKARQTVAALQTGDVERPGTGLYMSFCIKCHVADGGGKPEKFPALAGNPAVLAPDATSLIRLVLQGGSSAQTLTGPKHRKMPAFASKLTDTEIARVLTFVRTTWGNQARAVTARDVSVLRAKLNQ